MFYEALDDEQFEERGSGYIFSFEMKSIKLFTITSSGKPCRSSLNVCKRLNRDFTLHVMNRHVVQSC